MSTVLVVDDNVDGADALALVLTMLGHRVEVTYDPRRAVAAALAMRPEVILLDINMPHLSGIEVCRRFRAEAALGAVHVVAYTAEPYEGIADEVIAAGFSGFLQKPPSVDDLRDALAGGRGRLDQPRRRRC